MDRGRFLALMVSGATWITGVSVGFAFMPAIAATAGAFVLLASLALAADDVTGKRLAVLWGCAMALLTAVLDPTAGAAALYAGVVFGTLCFAAWLGTGFLLLQFFSPPRQTARP